MHSEAHAGIALVPEVGQDEPAQTANSSSEHFNKSHNACDRQTHCMKREHDIEAKLPSKTPRNRQTLIVVPAWKLLKITEPSWRARRSVVDQRETKTSPLLHRHPSEHSTVFDGFHPVKVRHWMVDLCTFVEPERISSASPPPL